ncbi:MAG TPA: hypothetical protein VFA16_22900 [Mycobacterium sp.]|uniref:hypothetical protein n=1 Tax=Mycobacterium sp. TaxID=1785 RepID=UPI002D311B9D|nr:hypothetical protein [Mycobacterium sp.]HZU50073.1 hypothetical protein [Mycobacterium sp.]
MTQARVRVVFGCQVCGAVPEPVPDSNLVVVRHAAGCEVLVERIKTRWWPNVHDGAQLPPSPPAQPFAKWGRGGSRRQRSRHSAA